MAKKLNYDPNEKCTQAIVFARVSSKKQKDKGVSLDVQMETITQYCIDNGLKIVKDLSIDESSTKGERKQYHEMLDFAKTCPGKIAIIVNYVDRLQRSYDDTYELNKLRKEGKIEIHFLKESLIITKDSAAMDLTFWNMHVLMANFQVNTMIDKVKASQTQNWAAGKWQGLAPIFNNIKSDTKSSSNASLPQSVAKTAAEESSKIGTTLSPKSIGNDAASYKIAQNNKPNIANDANIPSMKKTQITILIEF